VRNSTISGNAATAGGGAAFGAGPGQMTLRGDGSIAFENSTIASNNAFDAEMAGGLHLAADGPGGPPDYAPRIVALDSTIVADNRADGEPGDLVDSSQSGGFEAAFSLVEAPGAAALIQTPARPNIVGRDPRLAPLEESLGATPTHRPDTDSPAIDQGRSGPGLAKDQRGVDRTVDQGVSNPPGGDGTDIGSVEVAPIPSLGLCRGEEATIRAARAGSVTRGTPGRDVILGSRGSDEIRAGRGRDLICAGAGDDSVQGGAGADTLLGLAGGDQLFGRSGADVLDGGRGRDRLGGATGADRLFGGPGADRLGGGADRDGIFGQGGRDNMRGGKAADDLDGGSGADKLVGGPGPDRLRGGPGDDREVQ
jgi:Ca2+-binding RTX toxin-like protein